MIDCSSSPYANQHDAFEYGKVVGSRNGLSLPAARELEAALPQGRLVVIHGAGHVVNLAAPALFNDALRNFLDGLQTQ